jgi:hypothetical protein
MLVNDYGSKKSSWFVVPTTEKVSRVVISMESLKWDVSPKRYIEDWNQCPVFTTGASRVSEAEADGDKLE